MFCQKIYNRKFISDIKKFSEKTLYLSILFIKPKTFYIKKSKMLLHFKKPSGDCKLYIILFCLPTTTNDDAPTAQRRRRMSHLKKTRFFDDPATFFNDFAAIFYNLQSFSTILRQFSTILQRFSTILRQFSTILQRFSTILRRFYDDSATILHIQRLLNG